MNLCIYSPYLSTGIIGGGEKHILEFARVATKKHNVFIAVSFAGNAEAFQTLIAELAEKLNTFLGWSTDIFSFVPTPLGTTAPAWKKVLWTRKYEYLYAVTDGSLFFSAAKTSNLHIQLPFTNKQSSLINQLKLASWQYKNANSVFTKKIVEESWKTNIHFVHYPLIRVDELANTAAKKNRILSVGRFFKQLHSKRQDILITAFKQFLLTQSAKTNWRLILVGPVEDPKYLASLKKIAVGLPVEFHHSVSRSELVDLYKSARFYWHAAGFEQDELKHPDRVEHFGISVVEAMAAGAVPVVVGAGGPAEILSDELGDLCWQTIDQCVSITNSLIASELKEDRFRKQCIARAADFSDEVFEKGVWQML